MLFPFMESRKRQRSTSSKSTTPVKKDQSNTPLKDKADSQQQSVVLWSTRRLFEDPEITIKSPFKIPVKAAIPRTLFSPAKNENEMVIVPRIRRSSSSKSPTKSDVKAKTLKTPPAKMQMES